MIPRALVRAIAMVLIFCLAADPVAASSQCRVPTAEARHNLRRYWALGPRSSGLFCEQAFISRALSFVRRPKAPWIDVVRNIPVRGYAFVGGVPGRRQAFKVYRPSKNGWHGIRGWFAEIKGRRDGDDISAEISG